LPALAPIQQAGASLPLPAIPVSIPSIRSVVPVGALPQVPSLTIPPIAIPPNLGLPANPVIGVETPTIICGIQVVVVGTPIGVGDCPTETTAAPGAPETTAAGSDTTVAPATPCVAPETTAAPETTEAPTTSVVTNPSVPFQASNAKRTADVTNSSVVGDPETTAAPTTVAETTPGTTADGCPTDGVSPSGGQGIKASEVGAPGVGGNPSGRSGSGGSLPITGLSLIALLVAGAATLSWGFVARMLATRKLARTHG
jgi:hypothetical protein